MSPIPGCSGGGESGKDYCYDPNAPLHPTNMPTPSPTTSPSLSAQPTVTPTISVVPTRTFEPTPTSPLLIYVGNNGDPIGSYPLGKYLVIGEICLCASRNFLIKPTLLSSLVSSS